MQNSQLFAPENPPSFFSTGSEFVKIFLERGRIDEGPPPGDQREKSQGRAHSGRAVTGGKKPGWPADGALAVSVPARGSVCREYRFD